MKNEIRRLSADLGSELGESGHAANCSHRHRLVQMRTRVMNQLHVVALNEGLQRKKALWRAASRREPESIALARRATRQHLRPLDQDRFFVGISVIPIRTSCIQPQQPILSINTPCP